MFDRLTSLCGEHSLKFSLIIQVDTLCQMICSFIEKADRAGVDGIFIGLESINPQSLVGTRKPQNNITGY